MKAKRCACGALFTPNSYQQKRCDACRFDPTHKPRATRDQRYCLRCGEIYTPLNSRDMYCGDSCRVRRRPNPNYEKPCLQCSKPFNPVTNQKYCPSCLKAGVRSRNNPPLPDKSCEICGTAFSPRCKTQNVCSPNCRQTRWYRTHHDNGKAS